MVRPESLVLTGRGGEQRYGEGRVTKAVYLGSVIEYEIDAGYDKPLLAVSYDPVNGEFFKVGDRVGFSFSRRAVHLLPAKA
jgi:ABC-type Fe3+/spermidine/putrescine transport system ATPase subunit